MFADVLAPVIGLIQSLMGPLLGLVSAVGSLYCIFLGVKFAKAVEPQDREKAKGALKNAIIGFILIFVLMLGLNLLMPRMINWVDKNTAGEKTQILTNKTELTKGSSTGINDYTKPNKTEEKTEEKTDNTEKK